MATVYNPSLREMVSVQVIFLLYDPRPEFRKDAAQRITDALGQDLTVVHQLRQCGYSNKDFAQITQRIAVELSQ